MKPLLAKDLQAIMHSKRANLYYLEHCCVLVKDGRVLYLTEGKTEDYYYNIPIANTTCIMLGTGTSITQSAMRMLSSAGVLVGFCGDGGSPLLMAGEQVAVSQNDEIDWLMPQNQYRPTEYVQGWLAKWYDDEKRFLAAKALFLARITYLTKIWTKDKTLKEYGFDKEIISLQTHYQDKLSATLSLTHLLSLEGQFTKQLYAIAKDCTQATDFKRDYTSTDTINQFLNQGYQLSYGLFCNYHLGAWFVARPCRYLTHKAIHLSIFVKNQIRKYDALFRIYLYQK